MTKTLKEFIHDRALWDHMALDCAFKATPHGRPFLKSVEQVIRAHERGDDIHIPVKYVHESYLVSISQAGEAVDKMRLQ